MIGYLVDAERREVRPIYFDDIESILGGPLKIAFSYGNGDTLYINEDDLFKGGFDLFELHEQPNRPFTKALLVGQKIIHDNKLLGCKNPKQSLESFRQRITFMFSVRRWMPNYSRHLIEWKEAI